MLIKTSSVATFEIVSKPFMGAIDPKKNSKEYSTVLFTAKSSILPKADDDQLVVGGAGEYEKQEVFTFAFPAFADRDDLAFLFEQDNRSVLVLPAVAMNLVPSVTDQAGGIDVLVIPVDKKTDPKELKAIVEKIDPRVVLLSGADAELAKKAGLPTEAEAVNEFDTDKGSYQEEKTNVVLMG